jgi:hypothetical protein
MQQPFPGFEQQQPFAPSPPAPFYAPTAEQMRASPSLGYEQGQRAQAAQRSLQEYYGYYEPGRSQSPSPQQLGFPPPQQQIDTRNRLRKQEPDRARKQTAFEKYRDNLSPAEQAVFEDALLKRMTRPDTLFNRLTGRDRYRKALEDNKLPLAETRSLGAVARRTEKEAVKEAAKEAKAKAADARGLGRSGRNPTEARRAETPAQSPARNPNAGSYGLIGELRMDRPDTPGESLTNAVAAVSRATGTQPRPQPPAPDPNARMSTPFTQPQSVPAPQGDLNRAPAPGSPVPPKMPENSQNSQATNVQTPQGDVPLVQPTPVRPNSGHSLVSSSSAPGPDPVDRGQSISPYNGPTDGPSDYRSISPLNNQQSDRYSANAAVARSLREFTPSPPSTVGPSATTPAQQPSRPTSSQSMRRK